MKEYSRIKMFEGKKINVAQLLLQIGNVKGLAHLGLGPVVVGAAVVDTVSVCV